MAGTNACLFAVHLSDERLRPTLESRLAALARFYHPLGPVALTILETSPPAVMVGTLRFDGSLVQAGEGALSWGEALPKSLVSHRALIEASDQALLALEGVVAAVAADGSEARMVCGGGTMTTLYEAGSGPVRAWATHAIAAGWLAEGAVELASDVLPELLAVELMGGDRTLIRGVRAVPPGTCCDLSRSGARTRSYWPAGDRWALIPEGVARAETERAVMAGLDRRLPENGVALGLTAGLDSRVVAVALRDLGRQCLTFTWGEEDWEDVTEGRRVAAALGLEHRHQPVEWQPAADALRTVAGEVRWTEGAIPVGFNRPTWPSGMSAFAYGAGGEIGRAYYYRRGARRYREPSRSLILRTWAPDARLTGARHEARDLVRTRVREWVDAAYGLGHRGWGCLDIVYGDQRVRQWGRGMLPRLAVPVVAAFVTPSVARALASLSLEDRVGDGFHRGFLASRHVTLAPPPSNDAVPGHLRSAARRALAPAGRPWAGLARRRRSAAPERWIAADLMDERPQFRDWLSEHVLDSPLLVDTLGTSWCDGIKAGLLAGESDATEMALRAAAPVALRDALGDLPAGMNA